MTRADRKYQDLLHVFGIGLQGKHVSWLFFSFLLGYLGTSNFLCFLANTPLAVGLDANSETFHIVNNNPFAHTELFANHFTFTPPSPPLSSHSPHYLSISLPLSADRNRGCTHGLTQHTQAHEHRRTVNHVRRRYGRPCQLAATHACSHSHHQLNISLNNGSTEHTLQLAQ